MKPQKVIVTDAVPDGWLIVIPDETIVCIKPSTILKEREMTFRATYLNKIGKQPTTRHTTLIEGATRAHALSLFIEHTSYYKLLSMTQVKSCE